MNDVNFGVGAHFVARVQTRLQINIGVKYLLDMP